MNFITPSSENIGSSVSDSIFTSYLISELIDSGFYERSLSTKNLQEKETFKIDLTQIWFKALNGEIHISDDILTFAITTLSAKRNWSDTQIKHLCKILNYDARKEIKNNPYSWNIFYKRKSCQMYSLN